MSNCSAKKSVKRHDATDGDGRLITFGNPFLSFWATVVAVLMLGPLMAYLIGRDRAQHRFEAAHAHFKNENLKKVLTFYRIGGCALVATAITGVSAFEFEFGILQIVCAFIFILASVFLICWAVAGLGLSVLLMALGSEAVPGFCVKCDYDLRGITSERCPECGQVFQATTGYDRACPFVGLRND